MFLPGITLKHWDKDYHLTGEGVTLGVNTIFDTTNHFKAERIVTTIRESHLEVVILRRTILPCRVEVSSFIIIEESGDTITIGR